MADRVSLSAPRLHVILEDGTQHDVQTDNRDLLAWDRSRAKHKWPTAQDAPFVWMTFLSWSALRREQLTALSLADYEAQVVQCAPEDEPEPQDPTSEAVALDS